MLMRGKSLNFKYGTFIGRFSSDMLVSRAAKRLTSHQFRGVWREAEGGMGRVGGVKSTRR